MTVRPTDLDPIVLVLVGKPARGKSYTSRKLAQYLGWLGYRTRVFNVGSYRRETLGAGQDHHFFDPRNQRAVQARREVASLALQDLLQWIRAGGEVGIYDATNSTRERRSWVLDACHSAGVQVAFLELQCDDPQIIEANIRETKVTSPDYEGRPPEEAAADFRARVGHYSSTYEPVEDPDLRWVRIVDAGRQVVVNRVSGWLAGRIVPFLLNLHLQPRPVYLSRHGQSLYNVDGRIGGDSSLSADGHRYANALGTFLGDELPADKPLAVWTSTLRRTIETARPSERPHRPWKLLDEIDAGVCDGMTYEQIERTLPAEFEARRQDKFRYRYPRGESYEDVIARLEPVVLELERQRSPVLVIAHQAILRALYAYFQGIPPETCPTIPIPLHTVVRLQPGAYGCRETRCPLSPAADAPTDASCPPTSPASSFLA